jgi:hypothetical protein
MANTNQHSTEQLLLQNHARIGQGLIYLAQGLLPFVKETLQRRYRENWETVVKDCLADKQFHFQGNQVNLEDSQALLQIIKKRDDAFKNTLSQDNINLVYDLADIRRKWAHPGLSEWIKLKLFTPEYTYCSLYKILPVLEAIQAKDGIDEVKRLMAEVVPLLQEKPEYKNQLQSRLIQEKTEGFVGRKFVFDAIQSFLDHQPNGYFIIEGDPGIGKSAILAKYVEKTGCVAHFNIRSLGVNRAEKFLESICTQLISRYNLPYSILPADARKDGQFFAKLLDEIVSKQKSGTKLIIAVDALDEVDHSDHSGANILYLPISLPKGVYFLLTQRPLTLPLTVTTPIHRFNLMQYQAESLADIKTYIREALKRPQLNAWVQNQGLSEENFITQLADKSENNFMYLRYILCDIEIGKYQNLTINQLPQGLQSYYEDHWRQMGMMAKPLPRTKIKIVYVLSELRETVSRDLIVDFVKEDALTVQEVLEEWEQFLREEVIGGETRYGIYHQSFCDFLVRKDIVQAAGVTPPEINAQIADNLIGGIFGHG